MLFHKCYRPIKILQPYRQKLNVVGCWSYPKKPEVFRCAKSSSTSVTFSSRPVTVINIIGYTWLIVSRYSDSLRAGRSWDRIPMRTRFSASVQTGSEAHPASYTVGTGSSLGVKRPGRDVMGPLRSSTDVKERVELYLYSPSGTLWPVLGWPLPYLQ
jgi:hypothetical protein